MNQQNAEYLQNLLKFTGFGEGMQEELQTRLQEQKPEFTLQHRSQIGTDQVEASLLFRKSDQSDMYFFNRFYLKLKDENGAEDFTQSFPISREHSFTLKEAYNLMKGRSVHKELRSRAGENYQAWLKLDFREKDDYGNFKMTQYHQNYGYDLKQVLAKYPIREMESPQTAQSLVRSLERGNRQSVTMTVEGRDQKLFVEASPQYKSLNVFNSQFLKINVHAQKQNDTEIQALPDLSQGIQPIKPKGPEPDDPMQNQERKISKKHKQDLR